MSCWSPMMSEAQDRLLKTLDDLRRKVMSEEIESLVVVAGCEDGFVLTRVIGELMPPHGILILQEIADEQRRIFLERNNKTDEGGPRLGAVDDDD